MAVRLACLLLDSTINHRGDFMVTACSLHARMSAARSLRWHTCTAAVLGQACTVLVFCWRYSDGVDVFRNVVQCSAVQQA